MMATHRPNNPAHPTVSEKEPVAIADTIKAIAAVAAALGWTFDDGLVAAVVSLVSAAVFIYTSVWTRRKVTSPATLAADYKRFTTGRLRDENEPE